MYVVYKLPYMFVYKSISCKSIKIINTWLLLAAISQNAHIYFHINFLIYTKELPYIVSRLRVDNV